MIPSSLRKRNVVAIACVVFCCTLSFTTLNGVWAQQQERDSERPRRIQIHWGELPSSDDVQFLRTRVPGGWFVLVRQNPPGAAAAAAGGAFFYPDPHSLWDGRSEPN